MRRANLGILAGTAVALVLAAATTAGAQNAMPLPDAGGPRSMVKPSMPGADDSMRNRSVAPGASAQPTRRNVAQPSPVLMFPATTPPTVREPSRRSGDNANATVASPVAESAVASPVVTSPVVTSPAISRPAAASFTGTDSQISDKLKELVTSKQLDRTISRKNERDAVVALYQNNRFAPLWIAGGAPSSRAQAVIAYLKTIEADALDPNDYPVPELAASTAEGLADAELKFTLMLLTYARHAINGRVHWSRVNKDIEYKDQFDPANVLSQVASTSDVARTLTAFNPPQPGYKALKAKLAEMRNPPVEPGPARIESGPLLRYGKDRRGQEVFMIDPRVPMLRERLGLPAEADNRYNKPLAEAVAKFQKQNGLSVSGQLNAATIEALNGPSHERQLQAILATMERWRWMPRDLGKVHVALNIPDYHLRVVNNGTPAWTTRVVVGKPSQATPLLTETMKFITVNPTWNVPQSIIYNELLPIYETSDPAIFDKMGLRVERNGGDIRVYQPPGERNALGRIRFNFPNKFLVYQHDTPEKHYFAHDKRAYSHGCMRVQDPMKYAEVLLSFAALRGNHTQDSLRKMFGGEERQIDFQTHIPVHISYQTAFVDDAGKLQIREDIYGLDKQVLALLKGSERMVADVAVERPADPNFKPTGGDRQRLNSAAGVSSPFALFEQIFR